MAYKKCKWCGQSFNDTSWFGESYCGERCKLEAAGHNSGSSRSSGSSVGSGNLSGSKFKKGCLWIIVIAVIGIIGAILSKNDTSKSSENIPESSVDVSEPSVDISEPSNTKQNTFQEKTDLEEVDLEEIDSEEE